MKIHRLLMDTLRSKTVKLGATLMLVALGMGFLPVFSGKASAKTYSSSISQTRLARPQRAGQWIEVDLSEQTLTAWNGRTPVKSYIVSTGKSRTPTPTGTYSIQSKYSSTSMRGANYYVPDVPYTMYYSGGYAMHGAYWHNSFGTPVSHGCVNLPVRQARWLYRWAPVGTRVVVHR
jgi:lipoprotein-anchoring transpeptidase ErfK/SrfK